MRSGCGAYSRCSDRLDGAVDDAEPQRRRDRVDSRGGFQFLRGGSEMVFDRSLRETENLSCFPACFAVADP